MSTNNYWRWLIKKREELPKHCKTKCVHYGTPDYDIFCDSCVVMKEMETIDKCIENIHIFKIDSELLKKEV